MPTTTHKRRRRPPRNRAPKPGPWPTQGACATTASRLERTETATAQWSSAGSARAPKAPPSRQAQNACKNLLPDRGLPGEGPPPSETTFDRLVKIARCMRQHGIAEFPDPRATRPTNLSLGRYREVTDYDERSCCSPVPSISKPRPMDSLDGVRGAPARPSSLTELSERPSPHSSLVGAHTEPRHGILVG